MASISNTYNNYMGAYTSLYSNFNKTSNTQEAINANTNDKIQKMEDIFLIERQKHDFADEFLALHTDGNTAFLEFMDLKQHLLKNVPLPTEQNFEDAKNILFQEMKNILNNAYENKGESSNEFQGLLHYAKGIIMGDKDFSEIKQHTINLMQQINNNIDYDTAKEMYSSLSFYKSNALNLGSGLGDFFGLADLYGLIPEESKNKISENLQISQRYLYHHGGNLEKYFQLGDFVVSWESDYFDGRNYTVSNNQNNLSRNFLISLSSNFDTTQSFFDMLNQRDKLEKENQDLKNKQAIKAYGYNNGYSSTSASKSSKEIDSFINQMIKEAKA